MCSLSSVDMDYPGLRSEVKSTSMEKDRSPCLLYGLDSVHISKDSIRHLESFQSSFMKQVLGFSKRSHNTALLREAIKKVRCLQKN